MAATGERLLPTASRQFPAGSRAHDSVETELGLARRLCVHYRSIPSPIHLMNSGDGDWDGQDRHGLTDPGDLVLRARSACGPEVVLNLLLAITPEAACLTRCSTRHSERTRRSCRQRSKPIRLATAGSATSRQARFLRRQSLDSVFPRSADDCSSPAAVRAAARTRQSIDRLCRAYARPPASKAHRGARSGGTRRDRAR